jgi:hypothetical protein
MQMDSLNLSIEIIEHIYGLIVCRMYELSVRMCVFDLVRWILKTLVLLSFVYFSVLLFNLPLHDIIRN